MSSVNSTKSSNDTKAQQDDAIRKAREDYRKKEADLIKKHNTELRALTDQYVSDNDRKDKVHSESLKDVREKSTDAITQRDVRYRNEMEEMRAMHTKQLEKLMSENRTQLKTQADTSRSEVKQANLGKADRTKELNDRYETQHNSEVQKFSDQLGAIREEQKESVQKDHDDLNAAHEKEVESLRDDRNEKVSELKNEYTRLRQNTDQRLRDQSIHHLQDKMRMESNHMDNIQRETEAHNKIQDISREGYAHGMDDLRTRMTKAREADLDDANSIRENFQSNVNDRIEGRENRLEKDLEKAKATNVIERTSARRDAQTQIGNMRDAYQTKFDYLEKARIETLNQSNKINSDNLKKAQGDADKQMATSGRYYRERMEMENLRNRQALEGQESEFKLRQDYTAETADKRVDVIRQDATKGELNLRDNFTANIEMQKESNNNEKRDLRMSVEKEKNDVVQVMKAQTQKAEVVHQRVMADTVAKYEKRIGDMNEQFVREKRLRDNREKELVNSLTRQKQTEIDGLQVQHTDQTKQSELTHEKEMKDLARRQQEKIDDILRSVKNSKT